MTNQPVRSLVASLAANCWSEMETPPPLTTRWPAGQNAVAPFTTSMPKEICAEFTSVTPPTALGPAGPCGPAGPAGPEGPAGPVSPPSASIALLDSLAGVTASFLMSFAVIVPSLIWALVILDAAKADPDIANTTATSPRTTPGERRLRIRSPPSPWTTARRAYVAQRILS